MKKYPLQVFKFGGASLRQADVITRVGDIIREQRGGSMLVVVSAMGKTTNALERVAYALFEGKDASPELWNLIDYHESVIRSILPDAVSLKEKVAAYFRNIPTAFTPGILFDAWYDHVVSTGELVSSLILEEYLQHRGVPVTWVDARDFVMTDETFREGRIDWNLTEERTQSLLPILENSVVITQGFIGESASGRTTTLGRDGSDFSAAIFASCLHAVSVTIWKDVPGVMNADPKRLAGAVVFEELPFREAAEMTYYGASVIHPKTIKPLANKKIPLYVRSFEDPGLPGTIIHETVVHQLPPLIVFKDNQCLVSCRAMDYTFVNEQQLGIIFNALSELGIHINVMQNSAISFSFCIDYREDKVFKLIHRLAQDFEVYYNTGLTLITVKNYDESTYEAYSKTPGVILEQTSRSTLQVLVKNESSVAVQGN